MAKIIYKDGTEKSCEIIKSFADSKIVRTVDGEHYRCVRQSDRTYRYEKLGAAVDSRQTTTLMWDRVFDVAGVEK